MRTKLIGASLLAALATVATAGGPNLVTNGSFEVPGPGFILLQGWENFNGTVAIDASVEAPALDGTNSVKMFGNGPGPGIQDDVVLLQAVQGIQPGTQYTLSANAWHNSFDAVQTGNAVVLQMAFRDANNNVLTAPEQVAIVPGSTPTDQWNFVEVSAIAPPNTTNIQVGILHIQFDGEAPGASFWDDVQLTEGGGNPSCGNPADFNGDNTIDFFDLLAFVSAFNQGCD
jgi:hypothetical protein